MTEHCDEVGADNDNEIIKRRLKRKAKAMIWIIVLGIILAMAFLLLFFPEKFFLIMSSIPF